MLAAIILGLVLAAIVNVIAKEEVDTRASIVAAFSVNLTVALIYKLGISLIDSPIVQIVLLLALIFISTFVAVLYICPADVKTVVIISVVYIAVVFILFVLFIAILAAFA